MSARLTFKTQAETSTTTAAKAYASHKEADYKKARAQAKITGLEAHAAKASIASAIGDGKAKLTAGNAAAASGKFPDASMRAAEAQTICVLAKKLADELAEFTKVRNSAVAQIFSMDTWRQVTRSRSSSPTWASPTSRRPAHRPTSLRR